MKFSKFAALSGSLLLAPLWSAATPLRLQKRHPDCSANYGYPSYDSCQAALNDMPGDNDYVQFVPPGIDPQVLFGPVNTGPWFYSQGNCIITVNPSDSDMTSWAMIRQATSDLIGQCVGGQNIGGAEDAGMSGPSHSSPGGMRTWRG